MLNLLVTDVLILEEKNSPLSIETPFLSADFRAEY